MKKDYRLVIDWRPFMLRPDAPEEGWPLPEYVRARMHLPDNPLKSRAKALGLTMIEREVIPPSRRAHECTEFARAKGKLHEFHASVLRRYWAQGENLNDWSVLRAAAQECGLDPDAMEREVSGGAWKAAVQEGLDLAAELGISAVPTFLVGERFVIQGAQDALVFRHAFERLGVTRR